MIDLAMEKIDRDEYRDRQLVYDYLVDFPQPSYATLTQVYKPRPEDAFDWSDFLTSKWDYKLSILKECMNNGNVILDGLPALALEDIYVKNYYKPIEIINVKIGTMSEVKAWTEWSSFVCLNCNNIVSYKSDKAPANTRIKNKCCDEPMYIRTADDENIEHSGIDSQWLTLNQRNPNYAKAMIPLQLSGLVKGSDMMWFANSKDRISIIGIVKAKLVKLKDGSTEYDKWFEVYGIRKIDSSEDISNNEQDKQYIRSEMAKDGFYNKFIMSYAPHLYGIPLMKEAYILAAASCGLKRPMRLLVIADPSMGKTELDKYTVELLPRAALVEMSRASVPGLTASSEIDQFSGRRHVVPGILSETDGSLIALDEIQLMEEKDFKRLNGVVESGKVHFAFASGQSGSFDARPAIIMSGNPHGGRIGDEKNIAEHLRFMGKNITQTLSRQTFCLFIPDDTSPEHERKVALHMLRHDENVGWEDKYHDNWLDYDNPTEVEEEIVPGLSTVRLKPSERFGRRWIRKILHYVIHDVKSEELSPEYEQALLELYMSNREDVVSRVNKVVMQKRFLRSGRDMARYICRLKGKTKPEKDDVERAMQLLDQSLSIAAYDPEIQEIDTSLFNNLRSKGERQKMDEQSEVKEMINKYMSEKNPDGLRIHKFFTSYGIWEMLYQADPNRWKDNETKVDRIINIFFRQKMIYETGAEGSGQYATSW